MYLAPPLHVGCPLSLVFPDRRGLKEQVIRALWLTQAGEREGYRMGGKPVASKASVMFQ